jgi:hypothetical protein
VLDTATLGVLPSRSWALGRERRLGLPNRVVSLRRLATRSAPAPRSWLVLAAVQEPVVQTCDLDPLRAVELVLGQIIVLDQESADIFGVERGFV